MNDVPGSWSEAQVLQHNREVFARHEDDVWILPALVMVLVFLFGIVGAAMEARR